MRSSGFNLVWSYLMEKCTNRVATDRNLIRINKFQRKGHTARLPSLDHEASSPSPKREQDFWTGRRQSHRPSSVQSHGSSRNSSLYGSQEMDSSYQSPVFPTEEQSHGSSETGNSPRGLFPAPISWMAPQSNDQASNTFSFDCEICGNVVKAGRRLDWQ